MSYSIHALRVGLIAGLLLGLFATSAWADSGWYAGIKGGVGLGADTDVRAGDVSASSGTSRGTVVLGTLGYAVGNGVRIEGEVSWRSNDLDEIELSVGRLTGSAELEGSLENLAFMVNGAYDLTFSPRFTMYVLGGVGLSRVEGEITGISLPESDEDEIVFAYQGGVGFAYQLTDALAFDVSSRIFETSEVEFGNGSIEVNNHHAVLVGLTYSF